MLRSLRTMPVICPSSIEFDHRLGQIEIDGAEPRAPRVQNHGEVAHGAEIFGEVRVLRGGGRVVLKHGVHRGVRHALGRADHAAREFRRDDFAVRVEFHDRAHHQAVFLRIERADAVREFLGQHGHGAIRKINGSAAQPRLAVQRRSAPHVMRNVGDVHLQLPVAVFEALHVHGVVEIARRFAVDRDDRQIAEIAPPGALGIAHRMRRGGGFRQHFRGKFVRQMMFADQDLDVHAEIAGPPENFDHASRRRHAAARKARHLHVDDGAIEFRQPHAALRLMQAQLPLQFRRQFIARRNDDFLQQARFVRRDRISARSVPEQPHDRGVRAADHAQDASFGAAWPAPSPKRLRRSMLART